MNMQKSSDSVVWTVRFNACFLLLVDIEIAVTSWQATSYMQCAMVWIDGNFGIVRLSNFYKLFL